VAGEGIVVTSVKEVSPTRGISKPLLEKAISNPAEGCGVNPVTGLMPTFWAFIVNLPVATIRQTTNNALMPFIAFVCGKYTKFYFQQNFIFIATTRSMQPKHRTNSLRPLLPYDCLI
jgi:hypothetical protein